MADTLPEKLEREFNELVNDVAACESHTGTEMLLRPWFARLATAEAALEKMMSPEMDWTNGEVGVGFRFRRVACEALSAASREASNG